MWDINTWTKFELLYCGYENWWSSSYADFFPNISDVVIWNSLTINNEFIIPKIFKWDIQKKYAQKTYFKWKNEHNNELCHLMETHKHHSFKKIANMFYKNNMHSIQNQKNTQST